jgi:hypothetical protein
LILAPLALASARWAMADTEDPLVIEWNAPSGCPTRERVDRRVTELLGGEPAAGAARLVARGTIEARETKFILELKLDRGGHTSTRKLESSACDTLTEAGALVIALAFDPDAVQAASTHPAATPSAPPASTPIPSASAPPLLSSSGPPAATAAPTFVPSIPPPTIPWTAPPPTDVAAKTRFGFGVGVDFVGDYGTLPGFSPGVRARAGLLVDTYRVEPLFEAFPSATETLPTNAKVGAEFSLLAGGLRLCRRLLPWFSRASSLVWLTGCVDGEIGQISATGFGVDKAIAATALWGAAGAELEGRLSPPGPIGIATGIGLVVPFDPRPFVVETPARDVVFQSAPISLRLAAGLDARF